MVRKVLTVLLVLAAIAVVGVLYLQLNSYVHRNDPTQAELRRASAAQSPKPSPSASPAPQVKPVARLDFNGQVPSTVAGQPVVTTTSGTTPAIVPMDGGVSLEAPVGSGDTGYVETRLPYDVQQLGGTVSFPDSSGTLALTAWRTSAVAAVNNGGQQPPTGLRLVLSAKDWELTVDGQQGAHRLAGGSYSLGKGKKVKVAVTRLGTQVWATLPTGRTVGPYESPEVAQLGGPWASWELTQPGDTNAKAPVLVRASAG